MLIKKDENSKNSLVAQLTRIDRHLEEKELEAVMGPDRACCGAHQEELETQASSEEAGPQPDSGPGQGAKGGGRQ